VTALSNDVQRPVKLPPGGFRTVKVPLAGYTNYASGNTGFTVYKGSILMCDVSDTDGYFAPKAANAAEGDLFGGIAIEGQVVDSSTAADGSVECSVLASGVVGFPKGSLAQTDIGAVAYASDDNAITTTSTNALPIGIIERVDDVYAWVRIDEYFMKAVPAAG